MNASFLAVLVGVETFVLVLIAMALAWPSTLLKETEQKGDAARIGYVLTFGAVLATLAGCIVMVASGEWPL